MTRSRLLEENIALLEARIRELEHPGDGAPSVQLHDPRRRGMAGAAGPTRGPLPVQSVISLYPENMGQPAGEEKYKLDPQSPVKGSLDDAYALTANVPEPAPQETQALCVPWSSCSA